MGHLLLIGLLQSSKKSSKNCHKNSGNKLKFSENEKNELFQTFGLCLICDIFYWQHICNIFKTYRKSMRKQFISNFFQQIFRQEKKSFQNGKIFIKIIFVANMRKILIFHNYNVRKDGMFLVDTNWLELIIRMLSEQQNHSRGCKLWLI